MSTDPFVQSQQTNVDNLSGLAYQVLTTGAVGVGAIVFFSLARPYNQAVYEPNIVLQRNYKTRSLREFFHDSKIPEKLPEVSQSTFGWFTVVYRTTEQELLDSLGIDATMFVKVLYSFVKISAVFLLTAVVTMLLNSLSLTLGFRKLPQIPGRGFNISDWDVNQTIMYDSSFIWGHVLMACILSGSVFYVFNQLWIDFTDIRQAHFRSAAYYNSVHARTILVTNLRSSMLSDALLSDAMVDVNVKHFVHANVGLKVTDLQDAVTKREKYIYELEMIMHDTFSAMQGETLPNAHLPMSAVVVCEKIQNVTAAIDDMRQNGSQAKAIHAGFVEFQTPDECHDVVRQLKGRASDGLKIQPAPLQSDLIWRNLGNEPDTMTHVNRIGNWFVVGLCFGWLFLLNALLPLTDPKILVPIFPSIGTFLSSNPAFASYLRSMMPPLLYNGFLMFVPILFRKISDYQGSYSIAIRTRSTLRKVYLFYVIGFFVMFTISSATQKLLANLAAFVDVNNFDDGGLSLLTKVWTLANDLTDVFVKGGAFWLGYTLNGTGFIHIELVRAAVLAISWVKRKFFHLTPRDAIMLNSPPAFMFDEVGSVLLFYFFISMVYALVQPLILLITPFYFLFSTIIYKWELMYIFGTGSDTGGDFYPTMYKRVGASVLTAQGLFITLLLVKQLWAPAGAMALLFAGSLYGKSRIYNTHFPKAMYFDPSHSPYDPQSLVQNLETRSMDVRQKYLHPAVIDHLILPLVDARVEHLLDPYFPELALCEKASNYTNSEKSSLASPKPKARLAPYQGFATSDSRSSSQTCIVPDSNARQDRTGLYQQQPHNPMVVQNYTGSNHPPNPMVVQNYTGSHSPALPHYSQHPHMTGASMSPPPMGQGNPGYYANDPHQQGIYSSAGPQHAPSPYGNQQHQQPLHYAHPHQAHYAQQQPNFVLPPSRHQGPDAYYMQ